MLNTRNILVGKGGGMKKKHFSFGIKVGLLMSVISILAISGGIYYFYNSVNSMVWKMMGKRLTDIGKTGSALFQKNERNDIRTIDALIEKYAINRDSKSISGIKDGEYSDGLNENSVEEIHKSPAFKNIIQKLRTIKFASRKNAYYPEIFAQTSPTEDDQPEIRFVYIMVAIPESKDFTVVKFIADADYEEIDENKNGKIDEEEQGCHAGLLYNTNGQPALKKAFKQKEVTQADGYIRDAWGVWYSAFVPILDRKNNLIAVMGLDIGVDSELNLINKLKWIAWSIIIAGFLIIGIASTLMANWFTRPLRKLHKAALSVARKDFNVQVEIKSHDEFGTLANSFNTMITEIKSYAGHLEELVKVRTLELEESLKNVQGLKNQQDGDYFLTSLIMNPLLRNRNVSEDIKTDYLLDQKKKFNYKGRHSHLGGDLIVTGNLNFSGKRYVMFFNGDAMGKSMQGAGGALVMGALLNGIMSRSAADGKILKIKPEEWMQDTYQELQRVFESFDGSMMVSGVLGLINEKNGNMLYWNAEHPYSILYRDKKATFLENEISVGKLGMPVKKIPLIFKFKMHKGDEIICGSDGRDDILLGEDEKDITQINDDEKMILSVTEICEGDLTRMQEHLKKKGIIIDDLSFLKISITHGFSPEKEENHGNIISLVIQKIEKKEMGNAEKILETLENKQNFYYLYYKGVIAFKNEQVSEAIRYLKQATDISGRPEAYRLLGKSYLSQGDQENSLEMYCRARASQPDHEPTLKMIDTLEKMLKK